MSKTMKPEQRQRQAKARREGALARAELREPSSPRVTAEGATSFPVKARDPSVAAAVEAFLRGTRGDN